MTAYNALARHILAPTLDLVRGTHVMQRLRELEESQWYSPQAIEELQSRRLQQTMDHVYAHVPYYRRVLDEHGLNPADIMEASDLPKLPVLTKDLVRANLHDLVADNYPTRRLLVSRTDGSTGDPLAFYTTHEDWFTHGRTRGLLAMEWADVHMGDRIASFPGLGSRPTRKERLLEPIIRRFQRTHIIDVKSISYQNLPTIIEAIRRTRPRALTAYPTVLALLAQYIKESGTSPPAVHSLLTGGEQIFEHQRALVRDAFGKEPFSRYGTRENTLLGAECEQHRGFHMFAQDLAIEVVDNTGRPVPLGREGRVLVTNLHARGMPFIRYDTGDIGAWATEPCPCGRGMPLLSSLLGRSCHIIHTPSGGRVAGTSLDMSPLALLGVSGYQLVQDELGSIAARLVLSHQAGDDGMLQARETVETILHRSLGDDMRIDVQFVESIEPTRSGKHVPIVSNLGDGEHAVRRG